MADAEEGMELVNVKTTGGGKRGFNSIPTDSASKYA